MGVLVLVGLGFAGSGIFLLLALLSGYWVFALGWIVLVIALTGIGVTLTREEYDDEQEE